MLEGLLHLVSLERGAGELLRDFLDIFIVAFLLYRAMLVLRGTRAMQMGLGVVVFGLLYLLAKHAELATLMSVLSWLASSAILIVVVVFQNDIRRALIRVGSKAWFKRGRDAQMRVIDEVVAASTELARHRMGALICLERDANVLEFVKNEGIVMDSLVSRELLVSLFIPEAVNKTHDGAVLLRDLRIARAGVFFPMPETTKVPDPTLGSRHRAAIGITEETDAVVIVVSEERGTITLCFPNGMVQNVDGASLHQAILGLFGRTEKKKQGADAEKKESAPATTRRMPSSKKPVSSKKDEALTKQSGRFRALKGGLRASTTTASASGKHTALSSDDADQVAKKTPDPTRVSVPMPTAKERQEQEGEVEATDDVVVPELSPSKPMKPTELPTSSAVLGLPLDQKPKEESRPGEDK